MHCNTLSHILAEGAEVSISTRAVLAKLRAFGAEIFSISFFTNIDGGPADATHVGGGVPVTP